MVRRNGSAWVNVASGASPISTESMSYAASPGYCVLQVKSASGGGAYGMQYELPR